MKSLFIIKIEIKTFLSKQNLAIANFMLGTELALSSLHTESQV